MGFLQGKRALITGIASQRSIASGIADAMHRQGAALALTYQTDKLRSRVAAAATEYGSDTVLPPDVSHDEQIDACFADAGKPWTAGFDLLVHCLANAPRATSGGEPTDRPDRATLHTAHTIKATPQGP